MITRLLPIAFIMLSAVTIASAQVDGETGPADTLYSDTLVTTDDEYAPSDPGFYEDGETVDTAFGDFDEVPSSGPNMLGPGAGFYAGPTFEVTTLDPAALDPDLDGDLVLYGGQVYLIINGWMVGGHWTSATLYDLSPMYDEFSFSYGGFLTGYDLNLVSGLSARFSFLIGGGDLNMIKKRADLAQFDSSGHELLERYRREGFFLIRPGASVGYAPLPFLDVRFSVDYLYPIGGASISDLKTITYGLHLMLGAGK